MTLIEFLLARIAEVEAHAPSRHRMDPEGEPGYYYACPATRTEPWGDLPWGPDACDCGVEGRRRRVLAECEAKRRIIASATEVWIGYLGNEQEGMKILRALALPFAGHSDYQQEWSI